MSAISKIALMRLKKELTMLYNEPPPGISAWASSENAFELEAIIQGADATPYARGSFKLSVLVPERYPFEPPKAHSVSRSSSAILLDRIECSAH